MSPSLWLAVCVYLVVGAVCLLEVEIISQKSGIVAAVQVCFAALIFAASWPLRVVARAFRWIS